MDRYQNITSLGNGQVIKEQTKESKKEDKSQ